MKVGFFLFYPTDFWAPGGGVTSLKNTFEALKQLGVEVELFDIWKYQQGKRYDILQIFGSNYQVSDFLVTAKKAGEKVVVKTIAYSLRPKWQWILGRTVDSLLPFDTVYAYRKRLYKHADLLIAQSKIEMMQLHKNFGIPKSKVVIIPNGVEGRFYNASPDLFVKKYGIKDFILMVGRICKNKGQIRLLEALRGIDIPTVFIGPPDPVELTYFNRFLKMLNRHSALYLGYIPFGSPLLVSAYATAKVLAFLSYGETFGNVCLEAGVTGANLVISRHLPIAEYFKDEVDLCDSKSLGSIKEAIIKAYNTPKSNNIRELILNKFSWNEIGKKYLQLYEKLLRDKI